MLILTILTIFTLTNTAYAQKSIVMIQSDLKMPWSVYNQKTIWDSPKYTSQDITKLLSPIPVSSPTPTPTQKPLGEQAADIAKGYRGVPYEWGGTSPYGFDCSGLMQYVYRKIGVDISRTTYTQIYDGYKITKSELKEGDLVFFAKNGDIHHVGMYIGGGQFIHAPQTGDVVKISNLSDRDDYYAARRIVK